MDRDREASSPAFEEDLALRRILEGTAPDTGQAFFRALVKNVALATNVAGAWVTEFLPDQERLRSIAFWMSGAYIEHFEYGVRDTPCEPVIRECRTFHVPDRVAELFPMDDSLREMQAVSYIGMPLQDATGAVAGHLAVLDTRPMLERSRQETILGIFAARAGAELRRMRAEQALRLRENQLSRLLDGAMDAIVELDQEFRVTAANTAAEKLLGLTPQRIGSATLEELLTGPSIRTLLKWIRHLEGSAARHDSGRSVWIPETLTARRNEDHRFPAEATLSFRELDGRRFYTLICRDVNDRLSAQQQIRALSDETERLRCELDQQRIQGELLGRSRVMRRVRDDVEEVAQTDASVLILGETGTGKEVVARAIHKASLRRSKPLVAVNCAAIPPNLIESEFFGHEKGAFTGATQAREGRFATAHAGTIFLDEIGELPLELQGKLLRVLQQGEFEPVGSSQTRTCDVRVIAATNRDLAGAVEAGKFRQDLYYRLNVYPIMLPALRERGEDVVLLANAFAQRSAAKLGRRIQPLSPEAGERLKRYAWPGNVRELENVIERGVITARDEQINLERALPELPPEPSAGSTLEAKRASGQVLTHRQLEEIERQNLQLALERSGGRVAGNGGAAELLGLAPSTVNSRLKALKIRRPPSKG